MRWDLILTCLSDNYLVNDGPLIKFINFTIDMEKYDGMHMHNHFIEVKLTKISWILECWKTKKEIKEDDLKLRIRIYQFIVVISSSNIFRAIWYNPS